MAAATTAAAVVGHVSVGDTVVTGVRGELLAVRDAALEYSRWEMGRRAPLELRVG